MVERREEDVEPGSEGIHESFSKFSVLFYTEKITVVPKPTANYSHVKVKKG